MGIHQHADTFFGYPVEDYDPEKGIANPSRTIYRLRLDGAWDYSNKGERVVDVLARFVADPGAEKAPGLVIGIWESAFEDPAGARRIVAALVAARDRLPALRALFLGDITYDECEISWIQQTEVSPILSAYPALECLRVRSGTDYFLGRPRHEALRSLIIESGGLDGTVALDIAAGHLPRLEHLELWLGMQDYGGSTSLQDLAPILDGSRFPALQYLGLCNCEYADALAGALATSPVVGRLHTLDLSLGNLSDEGARVLLESPAIKSLRKLDIHHHYVSPELVDALAATGIELDASERCEPDEDDGEAYRYVAHGE